MAEATDGRVVSNIAAGTHLIIDPRLISLSQIWIFQVAGAYEYLFPYINTEFRHIDDDDVHTALMAETPDVDSESPATAPFKPYKMNKVSHRHEQPNEILGLIRSPFVGISPDKQLFISQLFISNLTDIEKAAFASGEV